MRLKAAGLRPRPQLVASIRLTAAGLAVFRELAARREIRRRECCRSFERDPTNHTTGVRAKACSQPAGGNRPRDRRQWPSAQIPIAWLASVFISPYNCSRLIMAMSPSSCLLTRGTFWTRTEAFSGPLPATGRQPRACDCQLSQRKVSTTPEHSRRGSISRSQAPVLQSAAGRMEGRPETAGQRSCCHELARETWPPAHPREGSSCRRGRSSSITPRWVRDIPI